MYRRIFSVNQTFRTVNSLLIVVIVIWGLTFLFLESFICVGGSGVSLSCNAQEWVLLWFAITEVAGDIVILSLPYPCIRKLQMSKRDKIGLCAIFASGSLYVMLSIAVYSAYYHCGQH